MSQVPSTRPPLLRPYPRASGATGPMHTSFHIARVHGVDVGANWSWLIVVGLIVWSLAASVMPSAAPGYSDSTYLVMAMAAATAFFASLLLHELGHAVVAQREGMEIDGITLWVFGGVARFKGMFPSAGAEFRIALAGPIVSLAIGGFCLWAVALARLPETVEGVVSWLGYINLVLVAFNMLPALPLDGGRVLRSLLWMRAGDFTVATRKAGRVAEFFGRLMIAWGIATLIVFAAPGGLWFALIGWFVLAAARAEIAFSVSRDVLSGKVVADVMVRDPLCVPADMAADDIVERLFEPHHYATYPVVENGEIIGVLAMGDILAVAPGRLHGITARKLMLPEAQAPVVDLHEDLADASVKLLEGGFGRALVKDGDRYAGLLSISDVERLTGGEALAGRAAK